MKLLRVGLSGRERPALLGADGVLRDLAGIVSDIAGDVLTTQGLEALGAIDPGQLPPLPAAARIGPPVGGVGKMICVGLNYADHIAETGQQTPERQIWFSKAATAAHGPFADAQLPKASDRTDYEAELVAVIGARGRHISREGAPAAVFGWCAGNDVSVRDWQMRTSQWVLGKSFDTHAPFGPWIITSDEVPDPHALPIRGFVNGEKRQESNTRHLVFDVWAQLEELSQVMTLEPGDLIFTGTPSGVGMAMRPPQFLKDGDKVRIEIEGVGAIENTFRPEA